MEFNKHNYLTLYHYFVELSDALRPLLNTENPEPDYGYWEQKLFELKKIIDEILVSDHDDITPDMFRSRL